MPVGCIWQAYGNASGGGIYVHTGVRYIVVHTFAPRTQPGWHSAAMKSATLEYGVKAGLPIKVTRGANI